MSHEQLKFIFCDLLPDLNGQTVLDIGSRMGPVLYAVSTYYSQVLITLSTCTAGKAINFVVVIVIVHMKLPDLEI